MEIGNIINSYVSLTSYMQATIRPLGKKGAFSLQLDRG